MDASQARQSREVAALQEHARGMQARIAALLQHQREQNQHSHQQPENPTGFLPTSEEFQIFPRADAMAQIDVLGTGSQPLPNGAFGGDQGFEQRQRKTPGSNQVIQYRQQVSEQQHQQLPDSPDPTYRQLQWPPPLAVPWPPTNAELASVHSLPLLQGTSEGGGRPSEGSGVSGSAWAAAPAGTAGTAGRPAEGAGYSHNLVPAQESAPAPMVDQGLDARRLPEACLLPRLIAELMPTV